LIQFISRRNIHDLYGRYIGERKEKDSYRRFLNNLRQWYGERFYGSLVADVESGKLIGKIERINEDITYEGSTVRECEQKFKEAVLQYKKNLKEG